MYRGDIISCIGAIVTAVGIVASIVFLATGRKRKSRIEQLMRDRY